MGDKKALENATALICIAAYAWVPISIAASAQLSQQQGPHESRAGGQDIVEDNWLVI